MSATTCPDLVHMSKDVVEAVVRELIEELDDLGGGRPSIGLKFLPRPAAQGLAGVFLMAAGDVRHQVCGHQQFS